MYYYHSSPIAKLIIFLCRPYTLNQYRQIKPKEYMEVSKLKPGNAFISDISLQIILFFPCIPWIDLNTDELKAKRANLDRIKQFSKNLKTFNEETIKQMPKLPSSVEKHEIEISKKKMESKRAKALEFSKRIPKPKVTSVILKSQDDQSDMVDYKRQDEEAMANKDEVHLYELEKQHDDQRKQIEAIRRSMGMK